MTGPTVLLLAMLCPVLGPGQFGDSCEDVEVRAATCQEAVGWLSGWMPAGWAVVAAECREERVAAR